MVADLFQEDKGASSSTGKASKINVRPAKPMPKSHNREHRKTVGTQVRLWVITLGFIQISWDVKSLDFVFILLLYLPPH